MWVKPIHLQWVKGSTPTHPLPQQGTAGEKPTGNGLSQAAAPLTQGEEACGQLGSEAGAHMGFASLDPSAQPDPISLALPGSQQGKAERRASSAPRGGEQ